MTRITSLLTIAAVALAGCGKPVAPPDPPLLSQALGSEAGLGSKIAFTTDRDGRDAPDEIYVMNADGTDEQRLTVTATGNNLFPEWSPDASKIAFSNESQIYVMNADGTELTQLATGGGAHPCWSPDGNRIAFTGPVVAGASDILISNLDGTGLVNLTNSPGNDARPDWSPDGRKIAFNSNRDGNAEIYVMNVDGTDDAVRLTFDPGTDMAPEWSPNGQQITFESSRDGNREIYVMNADGTDQVRLTFDPRLDAFPSWSPNGRKIIFHRQLLVIPGLASPNGSELFVMNADGTEQTQLTHRTPDSFSAFASWAQGHAADGPGSLTLGSEATLSVAEVSAPVVVMTGLDNPRGLAFGPEGALYVAEAGRGGPGPLPGRPRGRKSLLRTHGRGHTLMERTPGARRHRAAVPRGPDRHRPGGTERHRLPRSRKRVRDDRSSDQPGQSVAVGRDGHRLWAARPPRGKRRVALRHRHRGL